jgi:hypothetical protein
MPPKGLQHLAPEEMLSVACEAPGRIRHRPWAAASRFCRARTSPGASVTENILALPALTAQAALTAREAVTSRPTGR